MKLFFHPKLTVLCIGLLGLAFNAIACHRFFSPTRASQSPPLAQTKLLGTNLMGVADWSTQLPFIDGFKSSRRWLTQCLPSDPGCQHPWNTEEFDQLDLDANGWVKSLPKGKDKSVYTRVATLLFNNVIHYPAGKYLVLYDGEGKLEYQWDATLDRQASRPGRDVIQVKPSAQGIYVILTQTDPKHNGNYLRNIRVIPAQYEKNHHKLIFNPLFLDKIRPFNALRFMDWMATNNSVQAHWRDRPHPESATYRGGVPIEVMVQLANRLQVDAWFNIPHRADDQYVAEFARLVRKNLNPKLKVYLEYSNEVWNPQFTQFAWVRDNGAIAHQTTPFQSYGVRSAQICDRWKSVFQDQPQRVQCVMATQTANPWVAKQVLTCPDWQQAPCVKHGIDALAITGYFSGDLGKARSQMTLHQWLTQTNAFSLAIQQLQNGKLLGGDDSLQATLEKFKDYTAIAQQYALKLVVYEGGSHVVGSQGVEQDTQLTDFFIQLHRQPEFYALYQQLLQGWHDPNGQRTLFMNFSDIGRPSKWGSWGVLESLDQKTTPRYQALIDYLKTP